MKVDHKTREMTIYTPPTSVIGSYSIVVDKKNNYVWMSGQQADVIDRFDPKTGNGSSSRCRGGNPTRGASISIRPIRTASTSPATSPAAWASSRSCRNKRSDRSSRKSVKRAKSIVDSPLCDLALHVTGRLATSPCNCCFDGWRCGGRDSGGAAAPSCCAMDGPCRKADDAAGDQADRSADEGARDRAERGVAHAFLRPGRDWQPSRCLPPRWRW